MYPVTVEVNGTGLSSVIFPDIYQNPFAIGIGVSINTGTATFAVNHCFDYATVISPRWNGTSNVLWFPNAGLGGASGTSTLGTTGLDGNYAFPVAAIQLSVTTCSIATAITTMNLIQASNAP